MNDILLGVNIDHVATLRQARGTAYPDPIAAALLCEQAGADGITLHLREDRRHIQDDDVRRMLPLLKTRMNLEIAVTDEMVSFACALKPQHVCLVPEKREELTTEGGLDVIGRFDAVQGAVHKLTNAGIEVSLFIDPDPKQIDAVIETAAPAIELHTGAYAETMGNDSAMQAELSRLVDSAKYARLKSENLIINAGHGLTVLNVSPIAKIKEIHELNIGHSLVADALFLGLPKAVQQMKAIITQARKRANT